jgi:NADH-quinone oxidoreductase subunit L
MNNLPTTYAVVEQAVAMEKMGIFAIPLLPLIGAIFLGLSLGQSKEKHWQSGWAATIFAAGSFVAALLVFCELLEGADSVRFTAWDWMSVGTFNVAFALSMDHLSGVMTLVVTGVGSLIHLYAIGYMDHDENRPRFFCYLNLFLFSMLLLVLGENLLIMFIGWEGVGLCSYLLIGFWFKEMPNAAAGQKAFVVNRIGDAGLLLGIFILFWQLGTLNFTEIQQNVGTMPLYLIEAAAILLFIGAVGKSAQIPLFVWLPDAMAGPTPVSALIHAATMVTAGVYMVTRLSALYLAAPTTLVVISVIGTCTAFVAATIALVQNDIKKVLAYSTVSQLGYMFMALGAGAFSNGIYHVVTHAFFKACLFMGAGSVIVGCHHEQDMRKFGGLRKSMKWTFITYAAATYAIAGLPYGSGFFSKDSILWSVYSNSGAAGAIEIGGIQLSHILWGFGLLTAFLTAFYMTRSLVMTFFGDYRGHHEAHESPWTMTLPLVVLALPSLLFGILFGETLIQFIAPWGRADMLVGHHVLAENPTYHMLELVSMGVAVLGVSLAGFIYYVKPQIAAQTAKSAPQLYEFLSDKWRIDELYAAVVIRPLSGISNFSFRIIDRLFIDGSVNGTGFFVAANGELARRAHGGRIAGYMLFMVCGLIASLLFWILL